MRFPREGGEPSTSTAIQGGQFTLHRARLERGKKKIPSPILLGSPFTYLAAKLLHKPNKTFLQILLVTAVTCPAWL